MGRKVCVFSGRTYVNAYAETVAFAGFIATTIAATFAHAHNNYVFDLPKTFCLT